jgi:hypothetical protein
MPKKETFSMYDKYGNQELHVVFRKTGVMIDCRYATITPEQAVKMAEAILERYKEVPE